MRRLNDDCDHVEREAFGVGDGSFDQFYKGRFAEMILEEDGAPDVNAVRKYKLHGC